MKFELVVTSPFDGYEVGERITDPAKVKALAGHRYVTRVPPIPAPDAKPVAKGA